MTIETINTTTLEEIFIAPSTEIKQDRFSESNPSGADCNGSCASPGGCRFIS